MYIPEMSGSNLTAFWTSYILKAHYLTYQVGGDLKAVLARVFFQTCRKGKMWFPRKDFSKLSQMISLLKSLDPVTHPPHAFLSQKKGSNKLSPCSVIPQWFIKYLPQSFHIGPNWFLWALRFSCLSYWTTFALILNFLLYLTLITNSPPPWGLFPSLFSHDFLFFVFISHRSNSPEADFDMKSRVKGGLSGSTHLGKGALM